MDATFTMSVTAFDIAHRPDRGNDIMAGPDAHRRSRRRNRYHHPADLPRPQQAFSGSPQGSSGPRGHDHEPGRQHARPGQCRHPAGAQGHERAAGTESGKRHGFQRPDHVPGHQHLIGNPDPGDHLHLSLPAGVSQPDRALPAHSAGHQLFHHGRFDRRLHLSADQSPAAGDHPVSSWAFLQSSPCCSPTSCRWTRMACSLFPCCSATA